MERSVPQGFAMALTQNEAAVNAYAMMTQARKEAVLEKAHHVQSKEAMQKLVNRLAEGQVT